MGGCKAWMAMLAALTALSLAAVATAQPASGAPPAGPPVTTTTTTTNAPAQPPAEAPAQPATPAATPPAAGPGVQPRSSDAPAAAPAPQGSSTATALTAQPKPPQGVYDAIFKILFSVFVTALILESALAVIFHWRPFVLAFDGRGVKTLVAVLTGWLVAFGLQLDIVTLLHQVTHGPTRPAPLGDFGYFVTALVLAGGSAGVNKIMRALGFRDLVQREDVAPKPPENRAWIAVRLVRRNARGEVRVLIEDAAAKTTRIVGTITGQGSPPAWLRGFVTDSARFPTVAGYAVDGDKTYAVRLEGQDASGQPIASAVAWGPYTVAKGAIIDIEMTL